MDWIVNGLGFLQTKAFPVYNKNIDRRGPPFAHGEFTPSGIAVLLLATGLDYHLARLKYLRDVVPHNPPLPHTPYFNWSIGDPLSCKLERLLIKAGENKFKEQLLEVTVLRDCVAHPKLYTIREIIRPDLSFGQSSATLPAGERLRQKTLIRKRIKSEHTRLLRLPLVPTWISYTDAVMCILIVNRLLNLLERKYGNPYAWVGGFLVRNEPLGFFTSWGNTRLRSIPFDEWTKAFFNSLSPADQELVRKRLGGDVKKYLHLRTIQLPSRPEFLRQPPPWTMEVKGP